MHERLLDECLIMDTRHTLTPAKRKRKSVATMVDTGELDGRWKGSADEDKTYRKTDWHNRQIKVNHPSRLVLCRRRRARPSACPP
mmetsp:Transcript_7243/g.21831  ORF Transcript_7243/g.21831 Transcript_7243/m.21831 type:complete len:85 (-) Transcript_7243:283-537(-)